VAGPEVADARDPGAEQLRQPVAHSALLERGADLLQEAGHRRLHLLQDEVEVGAPAVVRVGDVEVAAGAVVVSGAVLGGAFPSGDAARPLAPPSAPPSPSNSTLPKIAVFLCLKTSANPSCDGRDVTEPQKRATRQLLEALPSVRAVVLEDREEARQRFEKRFRDSPWIDKMLKNGDIPESFRVTHAPGSDGRDAMRAVLGTPGVDTVIVEGR
jgi:hypothetical protein